MTLENSVNISFQGQEANTLFFEPVYMEENLLADFRVMPNVTSRRKMGFVGALEKIVKKYSGCGFNPSGSMQLTDRWIETNHAEFALAQCWDEFKDTVYEELMNKGVRFADLTDTMLAEILLQRVTEAVRNDTMRLAFFGNRASTNAAYDVVDGLWTVLVPAFVAATSTPRVNASSGTALAAGDGIDLLRAVYDNQTKQLKGLPMQRKRFYVSNDVYDQYLADIEGGGGGDYGLLTMINGVQQLTFRGIQVRNMLTWNEITSTDLSQTEQHQVLLTDPANLVIATDIVGGENQVRVWYNEDEEEMRIKGRFKTGFNIVHPSLLSVAY
jgi:hypothetical protein